MVRTHKLFDKFKYTRKLLVNVRKM